MSSKCIWPRVTVGIIGGGQLGKMMTQKAKKLGFTVVVLDPGERSPAGQIADREIVGGYYDEGALRFLSEQCDVLTYDIEHIATDVLRRLEDEGKTIHPSPRVLEIIQDKLVQRRHFEGHGIPQPRFQQADALDASTLAAFGYPLVQKIRKGGYDGRGVAILRSPADKLLDGESLLEELVDIDKELAVMVARGRDGDIRAYPAVEMEFDKRANILDLLLAPARIPAETAERVQQLAVDTAKALGGVGVFGVEMFLAKDGRLLVNEVAPRPHNSGHYTFDAAVTSQFEQHIRAVVGLPLGSTEQMRPAVMLNLLGSDGAGPVVAEGFAEALAIEGVSVHIYGKAESRPFRKMGHVTVLDSDLERARQKALRVKQILRIRGEQGAKHAV